MTGIIPAWSCVTMYNYGGAYNPMMTDVVSWGSTGMTQADFWYDSNMLRLTGGQPPMTVTDFYYFFPPLANPAVWTNLNTWNMTNAINTIGMFYQIPTGTLDLRGWSLPNVVYAWEMFFQTGAPIVGNLTDLRVPKLEYAQYMFAEFASPTLISLPSFYPAKLIDADSMFYRTDAFANVDTTNWPITQLQNAQAMFWGCANIKPVFTNWILSTITQCTNMIQTNRIIPFIRGISIDSDYNAILNSFYTNTTSLICQWTDSPVLCPPCNPINAYYGPPAVTARAALITRGWLIADLGFLP
jgi:hypothetical protein